MSKSKSPSGLQTTNHELIQLWTYDRGGVPAAVGASGGKKDLGVLRIHFPGHGSDDALDEVEWDAFLAKFDEAKLAFVYDIHTADGELSRFCKFVSR